MYHIKNDKRQQQTADRIKEGLKDCLTVKHMSEISVSDIAEAAGVSRSTFYRSFDIPLDVLYYSCDTTISTMMSDYSEAGIKNADEFILFSLKYWRKHSDILEALVNCDRWDIVQKSIESHTDGLMSTIQFLFRKDFNETELDYLRVGLVGLISNMLEVWIRHEKKETPEQLYGIYSKLLTIL